MSSSSLSTSTSSSSTTTTIDNEKLQQFMGKALSDWEELKVDFSIHRRQLWIYKAMYDFGKPITSQELADLTGTSERYVREWLSNQGAGGYLTYDASSQRYTLPLIIPEHWLMKIVLHLLQAVLKL